MPNKPLPALLTPKVRKQYSTKELAAELRYLITRGTLSRYEEGVCEQAAKRLEEQLVEISDLSWNWELDECY
jgi:hypothetical protein